MRNGDATWSTNTARKSTPTKTRLMLPATLSKNYKNATSSRIEVQGLYKTIRILNTENGRSGVDYNTNRPPLHINRRTNKPRPRMLRESGHFFFPPPIGLLDCALRPPRRSSNARTQTPGKTSRASADELAFAYTSRPCRAACGDESEIDSV